MQSSLRFQHFADDGPQYFVPPTTGVQNGLPVFTWDQAGAQITRDGWSWSPALGTPVTVTYAFRVSAAGATTGDFPAGVTGFQQFNAVQIAVAEEALRLWAEVANISFVRVGTGTTGAGAYSNNASILFGNFTTGPAAFSAFTFLPSPGATGAGHDEGDVWVNISRDYDANPAALPFGAHILAHEIGHALGLLHPGDYNGGGNGGATYQNDAEYWQDSIMFTNMSYFGDANTGGALTTNAITPLLHDIAAAQRLYGANMTTRTGDTVYGFNSNTGHAGFSIANANQASVFCIWDAGGNDTLDLSGYTTNSEIDLREEAFSSAGAGARYNISIARGAVVENAFGGIGADTIIGNAAANWLVGNGGADIITGGGGNDFIDGGAGADIAVFAGAIASRMLLAYNGTTATIDIGGHETDQITNVETFQFANGNVLAGAVTAFAPFEYLASYSDLLAGFGANTAAAFQHYINNGAFEGRSLDAFNNYLYLASNPDLLTSLGANAAAAAQNYVQSGFAAHRPTASFNVIEYIASNPDLITTFHSNAAGALTQYVEHGFSEGRPTTTFDAYQYIASFPDLIAAFHGNTAAGRLHYVEHGFDEGRPADSFDALRYLASNLDLLTAYGHNETAAARHYVEHGFDKGRSLTSFDPYQYIASYPDLITALGANAAAGTLHFVDVGFGQGRARDTFDAAQYLANYADLQAGFGNDLFAATLHYIQHGYAEGRTDDPIGP